MSTTCSPSKLLRTHCCVDPSHLRCRWSVASTHQVVKKDATRGNPVVNTASVTSRTLVSENGEMVARTQGMMHKCKPFWKRCHCCFKRLSGTRGRQSWATSLANTSEHSNDYGHGSRTTLKTFSMSTSNSPPSATSTRRPSRKCTPYV